VIPAGVGVPRNTSLATICGREGRRSCQARRPRPISAPERAADAARRNYGDRIEHPFSHSRNAARIRQSLASLSPFGRPSISEVSGSRVPQPLAKRHSERSRPRRARLVTSSQVEYQRAALASSRPTRASPKDVRVIPAKVAADPSGLVVVHRGGSAATSGADWRAAGRQAIRVPPYCVLAWWLPAEGRQFLESGPRPAPGLTARSRRR
jgi:hypothetical protein